jgi:hypothetical protein
MTNKKLAPLGIVLSVVFVACKAGKVDAPERQPSSATCSAIEYTFEDLGLLPGGDYHTAGNLAPDGTVVGRAGTTPGGELPQGRPPASRGTAGATSRNRRQRLHTHGRGQRGRDDRLPPGPRR